MSNSLWVSRYGMYCVVWSFLSVVGYSLSDNKYKSSQFPAVIVPYEHTVCLILLHFVVCLVLYLSSSSSHQAPAAATPPTTTITAQKSPIKMLYMNNNRRKMEEIFLYDRAQSDLMCIQLVLLFQEYCWYFVASVRCGLRNVTLLFIGGLDIIESEPQNRSKLW